VPTLFTRIIDGELPARFVHDDDRVVAFLSINPVRPGHTLVVPRHPVDKWTDADPELLARCTEVAQRIGRAVELEWAAPRSTLVIAGFEVEHLHLHVWPAWGLDDLDFRRADPDPDPGELDKAAIRLRNALRDLG
jgi:diadenosine tetraphosphate (Ap4A) HIT family hydrolase